MRRKFRYQVSTASGQSLIEVLIAFVVSVVIGIALVSAGLATQKSSISARNKSQATKLALEYLEKIRLMRDTNGFSTLTSSSTNCYTINNNSSTDPASWTLSSSAACTSTDGEAVTLNNTNFYRKLTITDITANVSKKVLVTVSWSEGINARSVSEETTLSQWCNGTITGFSTSTCP